MKLISPAKGLGNDSVARDGGRGEGPDLSQLFSTRSLMICVRPQAALICSGEKNPIGRQNKQCARQLRSARYLWLVQTQPTMQANPRQTY